MLILGTDLETTGVDPDNDVVTEVGAVMWDTELNAPVKFFNKLMKIDRPIPEKITKLTGITDELLEKHGEDPAQVWRDYREFAKGADMAIAHNAPFERSFIGPNLPGFVDSLIWIDTTIDVDYPEEIQTRKLPYLAAEHGLLNPFSHRAVTDVLIMFGVASQYDWNEIIKNAHTPVITMRAMVTFNDNKKAKDCAYRWDADRKFWIKQIKEHKQNEETLRCRDAGFLSKRL